MTNEKKIFIIGGITDSHALYPDGIRKRFGGGAMYGSQTAVSLGISTHVITIGASDIDAAIRQLQEAGVTVDKVITKESSNYSNDYRSKRVLQMRSRTDRSITRADLDAIGIQYETASAVILYPTYHEVSPEVLDVFPRALRYVDASGYMRRAGKRNSEGFFPISQSDWKNRNDFVGRVDVLKISDEDIENIKDVGGTQNPVERAKSLSMQGFEHIILTRAEKPPLMIRNGEVLFEVPIHPIQVDDPAGAGEVFGVGFVTKYLQTKDLKEATAFGNACASFKISGENYTFKKAQARAASILGK